MKKIAVINDLSGFGKCSLTVSIPIISAMGVEVHPLPTAVLSNQTAYDEYKCQPLTDNIIEFAYQWKKLDFSVDAILTGFATDEVQLDTIINAVKLLKTDDTLLVVDPVMADNGQLYDCYNKDMCAKVKELSFMADIITPNLSELFILADKPYSEDIDKIKTCADILIKNGIKCIVVTGYKKEDTISNLVFTENGEHKSTAKLYGGYFSGTGDILSSIVTAGCVLGADISDVVDFATKFISVCASDTNTNNANDGLQFEKHMSELISFGGNAYE